MHSHVYVFLPDLGIAKHFRCGNQEDAHEFLRYTVDAMQKSCLPTNKWVCLKYSQINAVQHLALLHVQLFMNCVWPFGHLVFYWLLVTPGTWQM